MLESCFQNIKIKFGKITSLYSFKGWLKVDFFINEITKILQKNDIVFDENGTEIKIENIKNHGKKLLIKFFGIENEEDAKKVINKQLFIERSKIKYNLIPEDLLDCEIFLKNSEKFGKVIDIADYGNGTVIEILKVNNKSEIYQFSEEYFADDCIFENKKAFIEKTYNNQ